ncbi:MAG: hypothetical protein JNJ54_28270 [Myxococcaceae bacterium]|nr:hypothetical protein [Myxococcaceae bacterium]
MKPFLTAVSDQPHVTREGGGHFLQQDVGEALAKVVEDFVTRSRTWVPASERVSDGCRRSEESPA